MAEILHHLGCPKCWFYPSIKTFSGILSGARFQPPTVWQTLVEYLCSIIFDKALWKFSLQATLHLSTIEWVVYSDSVHSFSKLLPLSTLTDGTWKWGQKKRRSGFGNHQFLGSILDSWGVHVGTRMVFLGSMLDKFLGSMLEWYGLLLKLH